MRPDRLERGFEKARGQLLEEINIIEIIKSRRFFQKALKVLLTKKKRLELKERSRYISINPDDIDKTGDQNIDKEKAFDEKLYDASSAPDYTDGFYTSETDGIEMELSLAHHPPSNTPNEELMIFDDDLRQEVVIAQRDKDTIFYEESDEIKEEVEL